MSNLRLTLALMCLAVAPGSASSADADGAQEPDAREVRRHQYLSRFFSATGRRTNPSAEQLQWRTDAGRLDTENWPGELELLEMEKTLGQFFAALQGRAFSAEQVEALFTEDFRGTELLGESIRDREPGGLVWSSWQLADAPALARDAFAADWSERYQEFAHIVRTEHHVDRVEAMDDGDRRRLTIPFRITGVRHGGSQDGGKGTGKRGGDGYEDQGDLIADLVRHSDGHWQLARLELRRLDTLRAPRRFRLETLVADSRPLDAPVGVFVEYFAQGVSAVDIDGDGDVDLFSPDRFASPRVFRNEGGGRFTEVGEARGLAPAEGARSGYFFDWDNDGDQDALILTALRLFLFEQRDGQFVDVSATSGFDRMSTSGLTGATVADFDNDGLLDFYVANYGDPARSPVLDYFDSRRGFRNQLFRNEGGGRFRMITIPAGLGEDNTRWTFAALAFDYDGDGWQDLYVVNDYGPNQLYRNRGDLTFEEVTDEAGVADTGNGMGVSLGDLDRDGAEDLYVSNMISHAGKRIAASADFDAEAPARERLARFAKGNTLLLGGADGFEETETPELSDAKWAWGNTLFDYDNDGDLDVYVANGMYTNLARKDTDPVFWRHLLAPISAGIAPAPYASGYFAYLLQQESHSFAGNERNRLFQNFAGDAFRDAAPVLGADLVLDSRGVAAADLDGDGDLDLAVSSRNDPRLVVLWNELPDAGRHLGVELVGSGSNRDGIGARVVVECGATTQVRTHVVGDGYVSQEPHRLWFGVGDCETVDRVTVHWPSGTASAMKAVPAGDPLRITEAAPGDRD